MLEDTNSLDGAHIMKYKEEKNHFIISQEFIVRQVSPQNRFFFLTPVHTLCNQKAKLSTRLSCQPDLVDVQNTNYLA